jgi:hypothetical protein
MPKNSITRDELYAMIGEREVQIRNLGDAFNEAQETIRLKDLYIAKLEEELKNVRLDTADNTDELRRLCSGDESKR